MKKVYLFIIAFVCMHVAKATNPVPNSSFENWSAGNPVGWSTDNDPLWITITQVTPGNSGTYAAKGESVYYAGTTFPPTLYAQGFTVTQDYNNLEFFYKSNLVNGDIIVAAVVIYNSSSQPIAGMADTISTNASGFTQVDINIPYTGSGAATATITFAITNSGTPSLSSYFILDDVSLSGLAAGVEETVAANKLQVFPVPAHDLLTVKGQSGNNKAMKFVLADATGRMVMEKNSTPSDNFIDAELNLQGIAPGFYSLMMITDEKATTRRIIVE